MVEVLALLAKHELQTALEQIVGQVAEDEHVVTARRPRQQQRRLSPDQVDELAARYIDGHSIDALAQEYRINRTTVIAHLKRKGIDRRRNPQKMTDAKVSAAAARYAAGLSLAAVAAECAVSERTLRREFTLTGVPARPRRGSPLTG